jgi:predicted phage terminase large subunit-like protein
MKPGAFVPTVAHVLAARQELARRSLPDFACMVDIPTVPISDDADADTIRLDKLAKHHQLICDKLQDVADGRIPNLMLLFPPGSAKSTYADVVFIPWFMAREKRRNVILASYASNIAAKQGRRARQLIKSGSFYNLTGRTLDAAKTAADEWMLDNGSEFMAGGLLSGLTGNRAALGVLDDPIQGREAAESKTIRDKTWDAYLDDFCSRLIPGAPQVMILTRWHQDDPAGRILPEDWDGQSGWFNGRDGRRWYVLCCPAICDRADDPLGRKIGESLWPEWFNDAHWEPFKRNPRTWASLYQQKPAPEEGSYFKMEWLERWETLPKPLNIYGTSDYAVTEGGGDYTVHRVWGVDSDENIYRLDGWRGQTAADEWIERKVDLIAKWKPLAWFGEAGVIQKAVEPMLKRRLLERKAFCRMEWLSSISDKPTRARGFQARAAMGKVRFEPGADLSEFLMFPAGKHDDEVDVAGMMGRALDMVHPAIVKVSAQPTRANDRYTPRRAPFSSGAFQ